ncbi:MAG: SCP2 sterol-binding domain-containing protein [Acidimicrobiia bacterium]
MPEFLSPEWVAALDSAARDSVELRAATDELAATVQQVVPDAPNGAVHYHVTMDHGVVRVRAGRAQSPDLTLLADYEVARAINDGTITAQRALASGRLKIKGGMTAFVGHERALAAIGDIFGAVRATTTYAVDGPA